MDNLQDKATNTKETPKRNFPAVRFLASVAFHTLPAGNLFWQTREVDNHDAESGFESGGGSATDADRAGIRRIQDTKGLNAAATSTIPKIQGTTARNSVVCHCVRDRTSARSSIHGQAINAISPSRTYVPACPTNIYRTKTAVTSSRTARRSN